MVLGGHTYSSSQFQPLRCLILLYSHFYLIEIIFAFQSPDNQMLSDKWTEMEFAVQVLGLSEEEAKGIWSILAAICHLGCAGISVGECTVTLVRKHRCYRSPGFL